MPILKKALSNVMQKSLKKNNLYLRKATKKDMLFLYNIYNENVRKIVPLNKRLAVNA